MEISEINSIGKRLKFIRVSNRLNQIEIANKIDISLKSYSDYELDKTQIPVATLKKISDIFNVSLEFLINGKDLLKNRNEIILNIRQNTQFDTKIDNGDMVITARIPLFKYIGA